MIYILTGNIRSGKTTALLEWSQNRKDVDGILCPDDFNGKRYFLKIKYEEKFMMEVEEEIEERTISIGNFKFLKSSFETANEYLLTSNDKRNFKYLVIDELGKLELQNKGLHNAAEKIIKELETNSDLHLIMVIRSSLLCEMIVHYHIQKYELISLDDLSKNRLA